MSGLLSVLLGYPTVVFTGLLGLVLLYWVFVILGALDIDLFHADADGLLEGLDGVDAAAGVADAVDGSLEAADGLDAHAHGAAGLLHALKLRRAPATVTFSLVVFFGWVFTYFGVTYLSSTLGAVMPTWLFSTLVLLAASLLSLPLTSLATKPLEKVFTITPARKRIDLVGSEVRIRTGSVSGTFGQAEVENGGTELIINVRNDSGDLHRGDRALIIDFDREKEAYIVEAYDAILADEVGSTLHKS